MNDFDRALRSVAQSLVEGAPPPPPFPGASPNATSETHRPVRRYAVAAAVAAAVVGIASAAAVVGREDPTRIVTSEGDEPTEQSGIGPYLCEPDPPLRVTAPVAIDGPTEGPAPRSPSLDDGQRAIHWTTADGAIELRWPGRTPPLYNDGRAVLSTLAASQSVSDGRAEIDVSPASNPTDPTRGFVPDVVIESRLPTPPVPPCDLLELTVFTEEGSWRAGLQALSSPGDVGQPAALVDLQPRIAERRSVEVAPNAAIRCQGSDQHGTPPNRTGGADRSIGGPQPADALLGYLAATPGAPPSGYVEMAEPDGSITYGADPSGIGWTTLVFLARENDSWYLEGWTSSGC